MSRSDPAQEQREMPAAESVKRFRAGFDELYVNQIGPEQDAFFAAYRKHVPPRVR